MANLKVTGNYLNPYEGLHAAYRGSPLYEQLGGDAAWETYARRGQLDEMITILRQQEKLGGVDKFKQNYNTDFLDTDQKMMAAANELYADRETVNKYKENYIDEATGEVKERELEMTEYDWNKHNISALVDYNKKVYEREVEAKNKEDMNGFVKFMASIPGVLGEFGTGFLEQVENIWNPIQGTFNAISATIKGEGFEGVDEAFQSAWKDDVTLGLRQQLEDWERKYTLVRDINGNYTIGGKIFGGIATSYGQFAPTMMLNLASGFVGKIGSAGSKLNNFSQSAAKVINKAANLMYWAGLSSSNFGEFVRDKEMATVPTWQKLLNAAAKGTGEYLVMRMLNNVFGTTTLDKLTFGYSLTGSVAGTTATRIGLDFMHEGLEEALQDFSSYYIDVFFTSINENFGKYANYNLQTFVDAFVLGALSSIGGSAISIVTGKRVSKNEVARNRKGEIKVDRKGKVKVAKFNMFESYNIRANADGFTSAVNELMNDKTLTKAQRNSLYGQAYATIRVLSSYYGEIGQERFAAAESLINQLYEYGTKKGYYWNEEKRTDIVKKLKQQYQDMSSDYYGKLEENVEAAIKEAAEKAAISEINQVIAKEDLKSGKVKLPADKAEMEKVVQGIFDKDSTVERVVLTNDGVTPIQVNNVVFVPSNYLELGADGNIVYRTIAEQDLVQKTISGEQYAELLPIILSTYRSVKNDPNATMEQAIFELYFNPQFFEIMLNTANQETFQFLSKLNDLAAKATRKTVKDEIFVQRLDEVMVELNKILVVYLVNQQEANFDHLSFLNKKQKDWIHNKRYSKDLANRIIKGNKVTNEEWDVVKHRINAMPVTQDIKDVIWNNLQSKTESVRRNAITQMNNHYRNIFLSPYNGKTFLPNNSIANNTWNTWAKASGLTIDTLLVPVTDPDLFEIIQESEGEVSPDSTLSYYRKTFERYTNGKYTFQYKNGMVKVDEIKRDAQYGYYRFNKEKQSIYSERSERNRTIVERSRNANRTLVSEFISDNVDDMSKSYVEIDDLIKNPELLKDSIRKKIEQSPQKEVTPQTAFLYLRNETLRKTKGNTSIVMGSDGKFYFVNVKAAKDILINPKPDWQDKKEFKASELVKADYMIGKLAGLKVVKGNSTYYDPQINTIVLEQADNDTMTYLFLHEFQHAIQDNENLNRGLFETWLDSLKVDAQRKRIINDFRKHRPELFNDVKKGSKEEADIVQDSIYNMTGETQAYGLEGDEINDYYPVLSYVNNGYVNLVLPWGTHYKLNDATNTVAEVFTGGPVYTGQKQTTEKKFEPKVEPKVEPKKTKKTVEQSTEQIIKEEVEKRKSINEITTAIAKLKPETQTNYSDFHQSMEDMKSDDTKSEEVQWEDVEANNVTARNVSKVLNHLFEKTTAKDFVNGNFACMVLTNGDIYKMPVKLKIGTDIAHEIYKLVYSKIFKTGRKASKEELMALATNLVDADKKLYYVNAIIYDGQSSSQGNRFLTVSVPFASSKSQLKSVFKLLDLQQANKNAYINVYSAATGTITGDISLEEAKKEIRDTTESLESYEEMFRQGHKNVNDSPMSQTENSYNSINEAKRVKNSNADFEKILRNNTDDYDITQFSKRPRSVFILPDGSLRAVQKDQHHIHTMERIIANGYEQQDAQKYFKSLPQVTVQRDSEGLLVAIRMPLAMDRPTINTLLTIMDMFYDKNIEFSLGPTFGYDVDPSEVVVFSDEYDNPDEMIDGYIEEYRNQNILRNSHKKRYVSNEEADESNLKYFKRRNKPIQLDPRIQDLVKETTGHEQEVSRGLWKLIGGSRKGELNVHTLYEYIRTADTMNDYTFDLINKHFFKNTAIKSFKQLKAYASELAPKYYALRAVLKAFGKEQFLERKLSHKGFMDILENLEKRPEWKALYDQIVQRFESYKGSLPLDIDYQNMRIMFMKMFDGTVQSAGHIAAIAKWLAVTEYTAETKYKTAGQVKKVSTEKSIGEDIKLEDTLEDESARAAFDEVLDDTPEIQMIEAVINERNRRFFESEDYKNMDKAEIRQTQYEIRQEVEEKLTAEEVRAEYLAILTGEDRAYNDYVKSKISKYVRPVKNVKAHIRYLVNVSIRNNLSESDMKRFRKQYPEVFDADGRLNPEYMKGKSMSQLEALEESLVKVADKAKEGAFKSARAQRLSNDLEKAKRKIEQLEQRNQKLKEENKELKQYERTEDYKFDNDYEFTINSDIPMPAVVQETMETSFDEFSKSEVKYVGDDTVDNIKISMTKFFEKVGNKLSMMSQQDVDDVINFYAHSVVIAEKFDTNSMRKYDAFKMFTLAYLLQAEREGLWTLSESQVRDINNTLDQMARQSATVLSMWKQALKLADPNRCIINSIKRSTDVEFSTHAIESLSQAMSMSGKTKEQLDRKSAAVKKAIERLEYEALEQYKKKEGNAFDKLVKLQRLFMLSGPGTWIRNAVSNTAIIPANRGGAFIGTIITEKLFKHKKDVLTEHHQWRIAGTKPDQIFSDYVDNLFDWVVYKDDKGKDVTFYEAISDGLNKYNPKKLKRLTGVNAITDMIAKRVASDIFNNNGFTSRSNRKALQKSGELLNMTSKFVFKMLSDDPWIKRQTKYYMKRMLQESQKEINPTMLATQDYPNKRISEILVEAYKMATWDYMHKPNVFNKVEQWIREKSGAPGYFIFKQFLPFASAGWNWFIAGLELTPIGLAKGIIQYAKLEDMIQKMDKARVKGEDIASSRFAAYIARRNIGKGLIGTIGLAIGLILAFTGTAGIDDEDDKLKIRIGDNFYIDITDLFGSQGILLGMAIGSPFMDGEGTAWDKISGSFTSTLTQLFNDSVYNDVAGWFKWNDGVGEVLLDRFESSIGTFIPNAIKTFNSMLYTHQVKYDSGILGAIERWGVQLVPGLSYALPKKVDIYDGQVKPKYNVNWLINFINRLGPIDIMPYKVTDMEKLAMSLGVNKDMLTGNYDDIGQLSAADVEKINKYYGTLNEQDLAELVANKRKYRVLDEKTDEYVEITFNKMTDKQKKSVIQRIMSDNASAAKVYIWTSKGGKFYGTESEVQEYRKLGLNNVYVEMKGKKGFI